MFRGHVGRRTNHAAACCELDTRHDLGDAKVCEDNPPIAVEHQVSGLHITVDHAAGVCIGQRLGCSAQNTQRFLERKPVFAVAGQVIFERLPIDQFHDHVIAFAVVIILKIVDLHDIGVTQPGNVTGLALEPIFEFGIIRQERMEQFNGNKPIKTGLVCLVNFRHTTTAQAFNDVIFAECLLRHG